MPKFMMIYHGGGRPDSPEEGEKVMAAWMAWMGGIGENLVDGGNPAGMSKTVTANAADMDAAIEIAKGCPILEGGQGTVEIAEAMEM